MRPRALKPKDLVAVVAPAGPFDRQSFEGGLEVLSRRYTPVFDEGLFSRQHYLAGSDERRVLEFQTALNRFDIKAIFAARGGYGSMRLLPNLRWQDMVNKPLVGFSDITALHACIQKQEGASIHGPVLTQLGKQPPEVVERLFHLLENEAPATALQGQCVVPGVAEGRLVGGNLSVFTRLLGTPYLPSLRGTLLLLEDVTERPYRLDRMWTHLQLAGVFKEVAGLVLGDFTQCDDPPNGLTAHEILTALAEETGLPCAAAFPIGHGNINHPVALGSRARLNATAGTLTFLEGAVSSEEIA